MRKGMFYFQLQEDHGYRRHMVSYVFSSAKAQRGSAEQLAKAIGDGARDWIRHRWTFTLKVKVA